MATSAGRSVGDSKPGRLNRRAFSGEEDAKLIELASQSGFLGWHTVAILLPGRSPRQCRERWIEYLRPEITVGPWTDDEDRLLLVQIARHGHRWTHIAQLLRNRSANDVKNRWYSHLQSVVWQKSDGTFEFHCDADGNRIQPRKRRQKSTAKRDATSPELPEWPLSIEGLLSRPVSIGNPLG
jgi:hypothetical protein